jgi:hypothetical protein
MRPRRKLLYRAAFLAAVLLTLGVLSSGVLLSGCTSNHGKAGAGAAVAVAATGVYRHFTDECWAACTPGHVCNRESGLCEPGECQPACPQGQYCMKHEGRLFCAPAGAQISNANAAGKRPAKHPYRLVRSPPRRVDAGTRDGGSGSLDAAVPPN